MVYFYDYEIKAYQQSLNDHDFLLSFTKYGNILEGDTKNKIPFYKELLTEHDANDFKV